MPVPTLLWRVSPDGWPIERIDLANGCRNPIFTVDEEDRPVACDWPAHPA